VAATAQTIRKGVLLTTGAEVMLCH